MSPGVRDADRRAAHAERIGHVGLAETIDEHEPGDAGLARGQLGEELGEERTEVTEEPVGARLAGRRDERSCCDRGPKERSNGASRKQARLWMDSRLEKH